jgi:hypothetical protein
MLSFFSRRVPNSAHVGSYDLEGAQLIVSERNNGSDGSSSVDENQVDEMNKDKNHNSNRNTESIYAALQQRKNVILAQQIHSVSEKHATSEQSPKANQSISRRGKVLTACALQTFCSCSMVLVNKQLASSYNHLLPSDTRLANLNILLVVFQAFVAAVCVELCKAIKWVEYPNFEFRTAKLWAPVNLLFCIMLLSGMASLQHNTVPMVTVFKNIANIFITIGSVSIVFSCTTNFKHIQHSHSE